TPRWCGRSSFMAECAPIAARKKVSGKHRISQPRFCSTGTPGTYSIRTVSDLRSNSQIDNTKTFNLYRK
ncbi:MAG TPA: hypothetical protein VM187_14885, partial [Niastella sp.]|nr:hypothetical protein [Niastella sp.]